jgi:HAD superfamily hydrolase (TIGR01509 family)
MSEKTPFLPAAVIFDMDGLMLDTEAPAISAWNTAAEKFGYRITADVAVQTIGKDEPSSRAIIMAAYGPDFPYKQIRDLFSRMIHEDGEKNGIAHRPGLLPLLDHVARLRIPMAVATSTRREAALWKLGRAGIQDRFPLLVCGDEIAHGKPAPDIFLRAAEKLGQAPADCIGFEDSPAGLRALHAAGIRSVFVKDIVEPPPEVLATVWRRCATLADAIPLIG